MESKIRPTDECEDFCSCHYFRDDIWVDAQKRHRESPKTFHAPSPAQLDRLKIGDTVKICNGFERFWLQIVFQNHPGKFVGRVDNNLIFPRAYDFGSFVPFESRHILDIQQDDGALTDARAKKLLRMLAASADRRQTCACVDCGKVCTGTHSSELAKKVNVNKSKPRSWLRTRCASCRGLSSTDEQFQMCSRCKRDAYCSLKCQKEHWHRGTQSALRAVGRSHP